MRSLLAVIVITLMACLVVAFWPVALVIAAISLAYRYAPRKRVRRTHRNVPMLRISKS